MYSVPYRPIQHDRDREYPDQVIQSDHTSQTHKSEFFTPTPALRPSKLHTQETCYLTPPSQNKGHVARMVQRFEGHQPVKRMTLGPRTRLEENLAYLHELQRVEPKISKIYEAIDDRDGKSSKDLTIEKGDILMVLDSNRSWYKVKNYRGEVGHVPYTHLKAIESKSADVVKDQEDEGQDDADVPITQEHINHARLCNALTTVCSDALRKILIIQVPVPYKDISQAILAKQAKLTRLNNDQHQLVFPDPKGRHTGRLDQFDISLLYAIIRNISSVPPPSNGWGIPPVSQPRDTTLGASVERIRLYRNIISGHSVDGKISQKEFEDYWKMIEEVLNDIENVIGNHGYLEQLEKRRNQVITPHELGKTFKEYKKQVEAEVDDISSTLKTALSKLEGLRGRKK